MVLGSLASFRILEFCPLAIADFYFFFVNGPCLTACLYSHLANSGKGFRRNGPAALERVPRILMPVNSRNFFNEDVPELPLNTGGTVLVFQVEKKKKRKSPDRGKTRADPGNSQELLSLNYVGSGSGPSRIHRIPCSSRSCSPRTYIAATAFFCFTIPYNLLPLVCPTDSPYDVSGLPYQENYDEDAKPPQQVSLSYDESLESGYSTPNSRGRRIIREIIV